MGDKISDVSAVSLHLARHKNLAPLPVIHSSPLQALLLPFSPGCTRSLSVRTSFEPSLPHSLGAVAGLQIPTTRIVYFASTPQSPSAVFRSELVQLSTFRHTQSSWPPSPPVGYSQQIPFRQARSMQDTINASHSRRKLMQIVFNPSRAVPNP